MSISEHIAKAFDEVLPIIEQGAPVIATALGTPLAGTAIAALAKCFETHSFDFDTLVDKIKNDEDASKKLADAQGQLLSLQDPVLPKLFQSLKNLKVNFELEWDVKTLPPITDLNA